MEVAPLKETEALLPTLAAGDPPVAAPRAASTAPALEEEERQWIALEVHDRVAQTLAAVFQQLQALEALTSADPQALRVARRASTLLREAIRECRDIMKELHPPGLDEFGVVALIEEELGGFQEDTKCKTTFRCDYRMRRFGDVELALYRVFHEALINIRRHAPTARNVTVSFTRQQQRLVLFIEDDGPGFDVQGAWRVRRVGGLMSMQRRAELIGGIFELTSAPGQGTRVLVRVSVGRPPEKGAEEGS